MSDSRFRVGEVVRMRSNHSCVGTITGNEQQKAGRVYWAVLLADGSGIRIAGGITVYYGDSSITVTVTEFTGICVPFFRDYGDSYCDYGDSY